MWILVQNYNESALVKYVAGVLLRNIDHRPNPASTGGPTIRLFLASLADTLIEAIRRIGLKGSALVQAYVGTIRVKLFKIGAATLNNTRRVRFLLASTCPNQDPYFLVA